MGRGCPTGGAESLRPRRLPPRLTSGGRGFAQLHPGRGSPRRCRWRSWRVAAPPAVRRDPCQLDQWIPAGGLLTAQFVLSPTVNKQVEVRTVPREPHLNGHCTAAGMTNAFCLRLSTILARASSSSAPGGWPPDRVSFTTPQAGRPCTRRAPPLLCRSPQGPPPLCSASGACGSLCHLFRATQPSSCRPCTTGPGLQEQSPRAYLTPLGRIRWRNSAHWGAEPRPVVRSVSVAGLGPPDPSGLRSSRRKR